MLTDLLPAIVNISSFEAKVIYPLDLANLKVGDRMKIRITFPEDVGYDLPWHIFNYDDTVGLELLTFRSSMRPLWSDSYRVDLRNIDYMFTLGAPGSLSPVFNYYGDPDDIELVTATQTLGPWTINDEDYEKPAETFAVLDSAEFSQSTAMVGTDVELVLLYDNPVTLKSLENTLIMKPFDWDFVGPPVIDGETVTYKLNVGFGLEGDDVEGFKLTQVQEDPSDPDVVVNVTGATYADYVAPEPEEEEEAEEEAEPEGEASSGTDTGSGTGSGSGSDDA